MICYAVIDTNVLVSALLTSNEDAATVQVLEYVLSGKIIPIYSNEILREYKDVLNRRKFGFSGDTVELLLSAIRSFGILTEPSPCGEILPDEKDLPFYEAAVKEQTLKVYLVTGNSKHFPKKPFVVTARQMLEIINKS